MAKNKKDAVAVKATGKTITTSGELPESVTDLFAEALVKFMLACDAEEKEIKEKSA